MTLLSWTWLLPLLLLDHSGSCSGRKPCVASSSSPTMLPLGSSFQVFCTFPPGCWSMSLDTAPAPAGHTPRRLNTTTLVLDVTNIQRNSTYSCHCDNNPEPCGLDVFTGYPPAAPDALSCLQDGPGGDLLCSWGTGSDTYLWTSWTLRVRRGSGVTVETYRSTSRGSGSAEARVPVPGPDSSVFSVWVSASNKLGSNQSTTLNFTLRDIVRPRPPVLVAALCSSRSCVLMLQETQSEQETEAQCRSAGRHWTTCHLVPQGEGSTTPQPRPSLQPRPSFQPRPSLQLYRLYDLQPYQRYDFRVRARFRTDFWSEWSNTISNITEEDVPVKPVDVWYTLDKESLHIHWKRLTDQDARGRVLFYEVRVHNLLKSVQFSTNASTNHLSVQWNCFLSACEVTVVAENSRGRSPPVPLSIRPAAAPPPQEVSWRVESNSTVALWWRRPVGAAQVQGYLVEWYPAGRRITELSWLRLSPEHTNTTLTDIRPYDCYSGAVVVEYAGSPGGAGPLGRAGFEAVHTEEKAPTAGPRFSHQEEGGRLTLSSVWMPHTHSQGCVLHYNACLIPYGGKHQANGKTVCSVIPAWKQQHSLASPLSPGHTYHLWLTASTAAGEGPPSHTIFISRQQDQSPSPETIVLMTCLITAVVMVMICLWHCSAVQQRVYLVFNCLMLDMVPDPANSKWAKECVKKEGELFVQAHLSDSSLSQEPISVEVQELPEDWGGEIPAPCSTTSNPPEGSTSALPHLPGFHTSYLKSFSQQSDASDRTLASQDTSVVYVSNHGLGEEEEEDDEEDDEEEEEEFFPSVFSSFTGIPLGGKLTLDAVKIDCSPFLD